MGILTCDRVCFLGDCLLGENVLQKHGVPFLYDVAAYRQTLKTVPLINSDIFEDILANVCDLFDLERTL